MEEDRSGKQTMFLGPKPGAVEIILIKGGFNILAKNIVVLVPVSGETETEPSTKPLNTEPIHFKDRYLVTSPSQLRLPLQSPKTFFNRR